MKINLKFEPRDLWIGLYWDVKKDYSCCYSRQDKPENKIKLYFCLIPMLPLVVEI